jgi:hypothetical protein
MILVQVGIAEAQPFHRAGCEVLDQHVGGRDQAPKHLRAARRLQVEDDPTLVAVHHQERRRLVADLGRDRMARIVAIGRFLDLDHIRAHVGQHERAGRPRHHVREVDDLQTSQWAGHDDVSAGLSDADLICGNDS